MADRVRVTIFVSSEDCNPSSASHLLDSFPHSEKESRHGANLSPRAAAAGCGEIRNRFQASIIG
jgi:hypothetical protein